MTNGSHHPGESPPETLTEPDFSEGVDLESPGSMRAAVSNAMVGLKKRYYGKGPTKARTYFNDEHIVCVLEGGLMRHEETLLDAGLETDVREHRQLFQATMHGTSTAAIEQITGRTVLSYHSQIVFRPTRTFELFVLDAPPGE